MMLIGSLTTPHTNNVLLLVLMQAGYSYYNWVCIMLLLGDLLRYAGNTTANQNTAVGYSVALGDEHYRC